MINIAFDPLKFISLHSKLCTNRLVLSNTTKLLLKFSVSAAEKENHNENYNFFAIRDFAYNISSAHTKHACFISAVLPVQKVSIFMLMIGVFHGRFFATCICIWVTLIYIYLLDACVCVSSSGNYNITIMESNFCSSPSFIFHLFFALLFSFHSFGNCSATISTYLCFKHFSIAHICSGGMQESCMKRFYTFMAVIFSFFFFHFVCVM